METLINNAAQAFALGATWQTAPVQVTMSTEYGDFINASNAVLYTGDIVCLDSTGGEVLQPTTATLSLTIGCVGNPADLNALPSAYDKAGTLTTNAAPWSLGSVWGITVGGNFQPPVDYAWLQLSLGFTNGNGNITSAQVSTTNPLQVGALVITPYNASTNLNPQVFQIVSNGGSSGAWTAVGAVVSGAGTTFSGTTGSFSCQVGMPQSQLGPGWIGPTGGWTNASQFVPGQVVPVILRGFGRININAASTTAAGDYLIGTNASFAATRVAAATFNTGTGSTSVGLGIGIALEAYANRDTTLLTALGISGHDSIRGIIGKI